MPTTASTAPQASAFRVDRFAVPTAAASAFLAQLQRVQRVLDTLSGCKQNLILTQTAGPGEFNVVTVVEWATQAAMAEAKSFMQAHYAREGFDAATFMASLGVRADLATYTVAAG